MESTSLTNAQLGTPAAEIVEELPEWKVDATIQHRVNNVCSKLLRKGVRPTYQRLRANLGNTPARLLREALQIWSVKILPDLYTAPKVEWAERPKAISPRVAELFEEMWLQAVSAAQVHYELGDDSSARLTHRETIDMVCHELRRVNTRVSSVATSGQRLDHRMAAQSEAILRMTAEFQGVLSALDLEVTCLRDLRSKLDELSSIVTRESERQSAMLSEHLDICREMQRLERARSARMRRLAAKLSGDVPSIRKHGFAKQRRA